jgi:hypothetical protein
LSNTVVLKKNSKVWVLSGFVMFLVMIISSMTGCVGKSAPSPDVKPEVVITYSLKTAVNQIGSPASTPNAGSEYLVVSFNIENRGLETFKAGNNNFFVEADGKICDTNEVSKKLDNPLKAVDLRNGDTIKGDLAYEVPKGSTEFNLKYSGFYVNNIRWVKQ